MTAFIILAILVLPWLATRFVTKHGDIGGTIGLALAFLFFGLGHFILTDGMMLLMPDFVPFKRELVWITGIMEFAVGIALLLPKYRKHAGWAAIAMLVAFFPANIYGAWMQAPFGGHEQGLSYLLIRAPLQALLIWWAWRFAVR